MRYVLEVQNWVEWQEERKFDSIEIARIFGKERFPHNVWRILDRFASGEVVHEHDPTIAFEQQANFDIERFARSDRWVAQRDARPRQPQRQMLGQIASRQRTAPRQRFYRDMLEMDLDELVSQRKYEKVDWKNEGF
jgi:hypothetical protein